MCPKHRKIRREKPAGATQRAWQRCLFFFAPGSNPGLSYSPPRRRFCHRHIADRRGRGYTAFLSGCTRSGKASGRVWDESSRPFLQSSSNSRISERHSGDAGANPADCTNFKKHTKCKKYTQCAAVADKQCSGLQNREMWERYPPAVPFQNNGLLD